MSGLGEALEDLVDALKEVLAGDPASVWDHVPEDLTGRDVVVVPASNFLLPSETFDPREYVATVEVYALAGGEDNETVTRAVCDLLALAAPALADADYAISSTSRLLAYQTSTWTAYGISITCSRHIIL